MRVGPVLPAMIEPFFLHWYVVMVVPIALQVSVYCCPIEALTPPSLVEKFNKTSAIGLHNSNKINVTLYMTLYDRQTEYCIYPGKVSTSL